MSGDTTGKIRISRERLRAVRQGMAEADTEMLVLGPGSNMQWLLGASAHPDERTTLLLIGQTAEALVIPQTNAGPFQTDLTAFEWKDGDGPDRAIDGALAHIGRRPASAGFDELMRTDFALALFERLPGLRPRGLGRTLGRLRAVKDEDERAALRMNAAIADRAMQTAFSAIAPGMSEEEVARATREHFAGEDATPRFWIVGSGPNGAFPHHKSGARKMQHGDAVVIDIGARKGGYTSDITRMAVVGAPPAGYAAVHETVEKAVLAALAAARPGVVARDIDIAARRVIEDAGYGEHFVHRTGHGIGLDGHEAPYITGSSEAVIEPGMAFSIEPGIYLPGRFGIRLEEIVIMGETAPEILSSLPRAAFVAGGSR